VAPCKDTGSTPEFFSSGHGASIDKFTEVSCRKSNEGTEACLAELVSHC